jgi:hypothetical protein
MKYPTVYSIELLAYYLLVLSWLKFTSYNGSIIKLDIM